MSDALSLKEAAQLAGMPASTFRQAMTRLNGTPSDLRTPHVPGERARRYDPQRLAEWIDRGKPLPKYTPMTVPAPTVPEARRLKVRVRQRAEGR